MTKTLPEQVHQDGKEKKDSSAPTDEQSDVSLSEGATESHDNDDNNQKSEEQSVGPGQTARSGKASDQVAQGLNGIVARLQPVFAIGFAHIRSDSFYATICSHITIAVLMGSMWLARFAEFYLMTILFAILMLCLPMMGTTIMNIVRRLRDHPIMPLTLPHQDLDALRGVVPSLSTGRFVFTICAVAFYIAGFNRLNLLTETVIFEPGHASSESLIAAMHLMLIMAALCAAGADMAALIKNISLRSDLGLKERENS